MCLMHEISRYAGQVGFITMGMRDVKLALVGDTFHHVDKPVTPASGFKTPTPMVSCLYSSVLNVVFECVFFQKLFYVLRRYYYIFGIYSNVARFHFFYFHSTSLLN